MNQINMAQQEADKIILDTRRELVAIAKSESLRFKPSQNQNIIEQIGNFLSLNPEQKAKEIDRFDDALFGEHEPKAILAKASALLPKIQADNLPFTFGAIAMINESRKMSDAILAKTSFWGDTQGLYPSAIMTMTSAATFAGENVFDTGYLLAYNVIDSRTAKKVYLEDYRYDLEYYWLSDDQKVPLSGAGWGDRVGYGPNRYGLGKKITDWMSGATFGSTVPEIMRDIRISATIGKSKAAYIELLKKPTLAKNCKKADNLDADPIVNIIKNLNVFVEDMIERARTAVVPILLPADATVLVYYHPTWKGTIDLIQQVQTNTILATTAQPYVARLQHNLVFVPTYEAAKCGAKVQKSVGGVLQFDKNFFPIMEEADTKEGIGFKIIIPKNENRMFLFQDLTMDKNMNREEFKTNVVCEERYRPMVSETQEGWLNFPIK